MIKTVIIGLLTLFLTSCANNTVLPLDSITHTCTTRCGMFMNNFHGKCQTVQDEENAILAGFNDESLCNTLESWELLFVNSENGMFKVGKRYIFGATVLDDKVILLGTLDALPHEIGHVIDREAGVKSELSMQHTGWRQRGWCDIISGMSSLDINCDSIGEGR